MRPALAIAAGASVVAVAAVAAAPQVVGVASAIVNDVRIKGAGAAQLRPAVLRQRIALADQVQTGAASRLQVMLLDQSVFTVGANARLTIDRFVYAPGSGSFSATVAKGAFRFMSGGAGHQGGGSTINTPVSTIGIRGTVLDGVIGESAIAIARQSSVQAGRAGGDPQTATLVVLRGPGPRTSGNVTVGAISVTAAGTTVDLDRPLLAAYVPGPGQPPIGPFTLSLPGLAQLEGLILSPREAHLPNAGAPSPYLPPRGRRMPPPYMMPPPGGFGGEGPGTPSFNPGTLLPPRGGFDSPQGQQTPPAGTGNPAGTAPLSAPMGQTPPAGGPTNATNVPKSTSTPPGAVGPNGGVQPSGPTPVVP